MLFAVLRVKYERTLLKDRTRKRQDLTKDETCWSKERSYSKVTPRVFYTVENGTDASPIERLSTATLSRLAAGPHNEQITRGIKGLFHTPARHWRDLSQPKAMWYLSFHRLFAEWLFVCCLKTKVAYPSVVLLCAIKMSIILTFCVFWY